MTKLLLATCLFLLLSVTLSAQNSNVVLVKAGTKVLDYFPLQERYHYPQFIAGQIVFKTGNISTAKLN